MPNCSFQDARTACINYEALNELDIQSMKIPNTWLSSLDEIQSQCQSNLRSFNSDSYSRANMKGVSTRNYKANHKGQINFGHIQSICKSTVHFASSSTKSCNLDPNNSAVSNDYLSLSTISKGLIATCANCSGGIKIEPIKLQVQGDPVILKRRFLQSDAVLRTYSLSVHSVRITDTSPVGIGAVLEQGGRLNIRVSRKLIVTKQTQREALVVFWAVKRLHKYLFGKKFTIATDHEALKFIYHPEKSLARSSAAVVQRWSIVLSAYDYTVQHRSAKKLNMTLETAIDSIAASTFNELERGVDSFLLQYRNARNSVTEEIPSKLPKERILWSNMRRLESAEITYYRGNDLRPSTGIVLKNVEKSVVRLLDIKD
ncbi:unnamed protein product [Schistosoma curassoni]|uniref:RT_RNaseH domain-containing protein n=1 Tax=Schistosoma curassoni TaxID=6186 RepID=A0A183K685_9TREM|nr:unnamed protein product [Schistosoma curassoni]